MNSAVVSEVLLLGLHVVYGLLLGSVLQPGDRPTDPLQQLDGGEKKAGNVQLNTSLSVIEAGPKRGGSTYVTRQLLVVLHHLFVLLVDGQNLADTVGCRLGLSGSSDQKRLNKNAKDETSL